MLDFQISNFKFLYLDKHLSNKGMTIYTIYFHFIPLKFLQFKRYAT